MKTFYRKILLVLVVCIISLSGYAQNYIGLYKQDIRKKIKVDYPGFVFEKEVLNGNKSFLKYVNPFDEQTILFILDDNGYCTKMARMYNSWLLDDLKKEFDTKYKKKGSLTWLDNTSGKVYEIVIKKGDWFITVITRPKK